MTRASAHGRRWSHGVLATALAVVACGAVLGACARTPADSTPASRSTRTDQAGAATKQLSGGLRTDLEPLTRRFPALGVPVRAAWASGTMGSDQVPGPSTYWIDAVVTLAPDTATILRAYAVSSPVVSSSPAVVDLVRPQLPSGSLRTSAELSRAVSVQGWAVTAYLADGTDVLVLTGTGDH